MSLNLDKAKTLITHRANRLVDILIAKRGNDNPPFLSEEYASLIGIKDIEKKDLGKAGGILIRFQNGPKIIINRNDPIVRQNFSCAHEIGHLLFNELKLENFVNTIEHRTFNPQAQRRKRSKAIEKLCDEAATELLMPTSIFQKHLKELGSTISSIERLAEMYKVSIQSAAIRVSELGQETCMVLKWVFQKSPSKSIQLSWPKNKLINKVLFSPVNKIINPPSIFHEAYDCDDLLRGNISFKVGKQTKRFPSEIKSYGYGENRYIISLVFLKG
jgi:Zn-dependent peptidase ImmA (M78 family)